MGNKVIDILRADPWTKGTAQLRQSLADTARSQQTGFQQGQLTDEEKAAIEARAAGTPTPSSSGSDSGFAGVGFGDPSRQSLASQSLNTMTSLIGGNLDPEGLNLWGDGPIEQMIGRRGMSMGDWVGGDSSRGNDGGGGGGGRGSGLTSIAPPSGRVDVLGYLNPTDTSRNPSAARGPSSQAYVNNLFSSAPPVALGTPGFGSITPLSLGLGPLPH